jgi:hypothetical protein
MNNVEIVTSQPPLRLQYRRHHRLLRDAAQQDLHPAVDRGQQRHHLRVPSGGQRNGLRGAVPLRLQLVVPVWKPLLSLPESFAGLGHDRHFDHVAEIHQVGQGSLLPVRAVAVCHKYLSSINSNK